MPQPHREPQALKRLNPCILAGILIIGIGVRLALVFPRLAEPPDDPDNYLPIAQAVASGAGISFKGRPTAYRPPLYPLVLAPMVSAWGTGARLTAPLAVFHLGLGAAAIVLTHLGALRFGLSPRRALFAAAVVAFDPVLVVQCRSVMTETLAATLLAFSLWALARNTTRSMVISGVGFGLLALCRPSLLPAWGLVLLGALVCKPGGARDRVARGLAIALPCVLVMLPWAVRNQLQVGAPVWTTTHGGYTLYLANNPVYYSEVLHGPPGSVWSGARQAAWFRQVNREAAGMPEPGADLYFAREAIRFIRSHPGDFVRASLARLGRFWGVMPADAVYPSALRLATALWTIPLWCLLILGALRRNAWEWPFVTAVACILALTAVHAVFWTDLRMRAPIVPAIALLAANAYFDATKVRRFLTRTRAGAAP